MRNAKPWLAGVVCLLVSSFTVQTLSQTPRGAQSTFRDTVRRMQESRRAREQKKKEREGRSAPGRTNPDQRRKEAQERTNKTREGLLREKAALNPMPAQWEVIKPLLEKIRQLRDQPKSTTRVSLTTTTTSQRTAAQNRRVGMWKWIPSWENKPTSKWTEGQRTANELIALVGGRSTTDEAFVEKMEALRQCRREEAIAETQQQLRQGLTTRQEAALVLMRWL